jgi:hypothetical protein
MKALIISGETLQETEWDIEDVLSRIPQSTKDTFEKLEFKEQYFNRQENIYKHSLTLTSR